MARPARFERATSCSGARQCFRGELLLRSVKRLVVGQPERNADTQTQRDLIQTTLDLADRQLNTMTRSPQWRSFTPTQRIARFNQLLDAAPKRRSAAASN